MVSTERIVELPSNEAVVIVGFFAEDIKDFPAWRGISADLFIARYTPFTIVLTIDGRKAEIRFTRAMQGNVGSIYRSVVQATQGADHSIALFWPDI